MEQLNKISIQEKAIKQIETTKKVYLLDPARMFSEYNGEKENVKNYNGRQLLEMLQNADDAASKAKGEKKVLIKLQGNQLIIANTGHPFSEEGLTSIFHSHLSPKDAQEMQIGNKGLGFRSILSWANKVTIKSHDLCVAFSKEYSKKVLEELLTNPEFAGSYNKYRKQTKEAPISTLVCPEVITVDTNKYAAYSEFDTIIQIDLMETALKEVTPQIEKDIDGEVLIFLNHLESIELNINGDIKEYKKENATNSRIKLTTIENDIAQPDRFWNINTLSDHFEDIDRDYQLSVAWKDELDEKKDVIYSYFRTKVPFNFSGILHGTFELNADRNDIISDEEGYNQKLIGLIPSLIANTAEKIANKETQVNYKALSFTIFESNILPSIMQESDFPNKLKDALQAKKIFPTICNKYISIEDKPVYYKQDIFARLLPKDDFPDILICCEDEAIINYLSKFQTSTYTFQSLCSSISAKIKEYSIEQYSSLIKALIDSADLDKEEDKCKLCLFFDSELNPLPFNNPIFLPSNGTEYKLPSEVGVQIIHQELSEELKKILEASCYESLSEKLSKFQIKTFDFNAIVGLLISHYHSEKAKPEDIKTLNQTIYRLYQNEKSQSINWQGRAVPLITKNKKIELANKLYFGKEYGCSITEAIYNYNKNKLVNSPKEYGIDEKNSVNWKSYLKWLGVAELPRKIQVYATKEFADYAMKHYDFKNPIDNYRFKNFNDFKNNLNGYSEIKVTSIDDLDLILENNNSEKILSWLNLDIELVRQLEEDKETASSEIFLDFKRSQYLRTLKGIKFRNFLKWKLSNTAWLSTKSGILQSPCLCTTSATITVEFSPIIEKPNINLDATIIRSNNIRPEKVDYLLNVVGVNKTISSFATNTLYSILSKLPEIDPEGKKAKPLYRELATNYEEKNLDTSDAEYKRFLSEGMVFCKKKGEYSYEKANTVFYVDNKRYGETVINQFFTLEVDRRRGKPKIKKMFGVKPLENLKLNLINQPIFHSLNGKFEQEIEAFKPYVYVFRQDLDNTGKEKNLIKDVKFKLVIALSVLLELENEKLEVDLSNYEYFYIPENKTVFIKTPEYLDDEKKLKEDISSTIAEVFSALIDVDAQRQQIRELFSKSATNRDDIIRDELDDDILEKLMLAKEKLGITNDPKIQFWSAFVKCFPSKNIRQENITDEILLEDLKRHLPEASEQIAIVIDGINYDNYNEEHSLRLIIELLKKTGLSIESFNKYVYPSIDISEIYELDFKRIKEEKKREFKQAFYSSFVNSEKNKQDFLKGIFQYDTIKGNFKNIIDYDVENDLNIRVQELFQLDLNVKYDFNFEEIYSNNKAIYETRVEVEQISKEIANQFLNENPNLESLLYFEDEIENLIISLKQWAPRYSEGSPSSGNGLAKKRLSIGDSAIFYDDYCDLFHQLETGLDNGEGGFQINLSKIKIKRTETKNSSPNGKGNSSKKNFKKPKKPKEDLGFLGEYLVYKHLLDTLKNKESIKWVSAYAKLAGVNLDGIDGMGYDIEYIPNDAKYPRYAEVKVVGWENAFHITSNEIIQGEKLKRHYEIFLVRNITDPENISIEIIQGPFDYKGQKSFNDNELFTVINDSFILKFEKTNEK